MNFCEETINTWKLAGTFLRIVKVFVPIIIIVTGIIPFITTVTSGKAEDMFAAAKKLFFKFVAGLIVFLVPTVIPSVIELLTEQSEKDSMYKCTACLRNPNDSECGSKDAYDDEEIKEDEDRIEGNLNTDEMTDGTNTANEDDE